MNVYTVYDGSVIDKAQAQEMGLKKFIGSPCKRGHVLRRASNGGCAICSAESANRFYRANREYCLKQSKINGQSDASKLRKIEYNKLWKARNPNYFQKHYAENKDAVNKRQRDFAINNPEIVKEWARRDREKNKANYRKLIKAYKARKRNACPSWVDHEPIKELCRTLPDGYHIDHIAPLGGKNVCGLHVHWNLRHLEASENCSKKNKMPPLEMQIDYSAPGWENPARP